MTCFSNLVLAVEENECLSSALFGLLNLICFFSQPLRYIVIHPFLFALYVFFTCIRRFVNCLRCNTIVYTPFILLIKLGSFSTIISLTRQYIPLIINSSLFLNTKLFNLDLSSNFYPI